MSEPKTPAPGSKSETASAIRDAAITTAARAAAAVALTVDLFAANAGQAAIYEIQAAEIALKRSRRDDVKEFARTMRADYTDISGKLGSFLGGMNRPQSPPDKPDRVHQVLIDDLNGASEQDFDGRYIAQQKAALGGALALLKNYRDHGSDEGLRNLCGLALPTVEHHMHLVRRIEGAA